MNKFLCVILTLGLLFTLAACDDITIHVDFGKSTEAPTGDTTQTTAPTEQPLTQGTSATEAPTEEQTTAKQPTEETPTENQQVSSKAEELWDQLAGCWAGDEDHFAYFTYADGYPALLCGTWENPQPHGRDPALVDDVADLGGGRYVLNITYPPVSGDAADSLDLTPLKYSLGLDLSELHKDTIFLEAPDDEWRYYSFGGYSYDDAYDAYNQVDYASFAEMQEFWRELTGYWNSDDGRFLCFDQMDSNTLVFMEGVWDSGTRGWGNFEKAMSGYMDLPMKFIIYYPPVSNDLDGDLPAEDLVVYLDYMEMETHDRISVKLGENGPWRWYYYAGSSEQEAYPN